MSPRGWTMRAAGKPLLAAEPYLTRSRRRTTWSGRRPCMPNKKHIHVTQREDGWAVVREGASRDSAPRHPGAGRARRHARPSTTPTGERLAGDEAERDRETERQEREHPEQVQRVAQHDAIQRASRRVAACTARSFTPARVDARPVSGLRSGAVETDGHAPANLQSTDIARSDIGVARRDPSENCRARRCGGAPHTACRQLGHERPGCAQSVPIRRAGHVGTGPDTSGP